MNEPATGKAKEKHRNTALENLGGLVIIALIIYMCSSPDTDQGGQATATAETEAEKELACRQNLKCWAHKNQPDAYLACVPRIQAGAKYTYEWTDGALGSKFPQHAWEDKEVGTVAYYGNKIRFQNGFGAWQNITYKCSYNPDAKTVSVELY